MPIKTLLLEGFIKRLQREGPMRLTWLIGAGMSASAGVPLAADVSRRVILFDHLCDCSAENDDWQRPWNRNTGLLTYHEFETFLDWFDAPVDADVFNQLVSQACENFGCKDGCEGLTPENPQCYPLLFANTFLSEKSSHKVLTTLVRRVHGVNVAHLALAGILRDYPEWGHTVFTTNFDDLLLKSCLSLNHTARVFGEIQSTDRPVLQPTYPQIVHLHGRHTGYRLANTKKQFKTIDVSLRKGFLEHLRGSYLVVVGYSGWDDMAMNALLEWQNDDTLVNGIFWVPYCSEDSLLHATHKFLDNCPQNSHVVVNSERNLNADSFMLAMCRAINRRSGFSPFRSGILDYASTQHSFTLEQLKSYPDDDPLSSLDDARSAVKNLKDGEVDAARRCITTALKKLGKDTPVKYSAAVNFLVGTAYYLLNENQKAESHLSKSVEEWVPTPGISSQNDGRARASLLLGKVYLKMCKYSAAHESFKDARRHADRNGNKTLYCWSMLGHAYSNSRYSPNTAISYVDSCLEHSPESESLEVAEATHLMGDILDSLGERSEASENYLEAFRLFEILGEKSKCASVLCGLAKAAYANDPQAATKFLADATTWFKEFEDNAGLASIFWIEGKILQEQERFSQAIESFGKAKGLYGSSGYRFSECSVRAEIANCEYQLAYLDKRPPTLSDTELPSIARSLENPYALSILEQLKIGNEHEEEKAEAPASGIGSARDDQRTDQ